MHVSWGVSTLAIFFGAQLKRSFFAAYKVNPPDVLLLAIKSGESLPQRSSSLLCLP